MKRRTLYGFIRYCGSVDQQYYKVYRYNFYNSPSSPCGRGSKLARMHAFRHEAGSCNDTAFTVSYGQFYPANTLYIARQHLRMRLYRRS